MVEPYYPAVSPFVAGLRCRCPRCGEGALFQGFLTVQPACPTCRLDYAKVDSGDGPAVFISMIAGFIVVGLALWTEVNYEPPLWVHVILWFPLILILSLGLLRPLKALLIALQYRHKVIEGFG